MVDIKQADARAADIAVDLFRHAKEFQQDTGRGWLYYTWAGLCYIIVGEQNDTRRCFANAMRLNSDRRLREGLEFIIEYFRHIAWAIHDNNWIDTLEAKMEKDEFKASVLANIMVKQVRVNKFEWILSEPKDPKNKDMDDFIDLMADIYGIELKKS